MATNTLTQFPLSATGVKPGMWFLESTDEFAALVVPGFVSDIASAAVNLNQNDIVFAQYNKGKNFGMFIVIEEDGVFSLSVYNPNGNSFLFDGIAFVAKGGSDLNPGTSFGLPKLTIQNAIASLGLSPGEKGIVWVMDNGEYQENLSLTFDVRINAPFATLTASTGDTVTINDQGIPTNPVIIADTIKNTGAGNAINVLGIQSDLEVNVRMLEGSVDIEGGITESVIGNINSSVNVQATGRLDANIKNVISYSLTEASGSTVSGEARTILGPGITNTDVFGNKTFLDQLIYQVSPVEETVGREVTAFDSISRIVYNSAVVGQFTLSATVDEDIPIGTKVEFTQLGVGAAQFTAGAGVTIISKVGASAQTDGVGSYAEAWKYNDTVWIVSGDIVTAP